MVLVSSRFAILEIRPAAGGDEAKIWARDLLRMYLKYAQSKNWPVEVIDDLTLKIKHPDAYRLLRFESGVHRVQRIPVTERHGRIHTSTATVAVLPEITEQQIQLRPEDLEIQFFRASSQGGQNVQKVNTAVRLKHKPTGIVVECQTQRYQEQNRKIAEQLLKAKLWQLKQQEREKKIDQLKTSHRSASWGTQIRSYVLHPYKLVKDLRTGYEDKDPFSVLDGNLDGFIQAELSLLP